MVPSRPVLDTAVPMQQQQHLTGSDKSSAGFSIIYAGDLGYVPTTTASKGEVPDSSHAEGAHIMLSMLPSHALPETVCVSSVEMGCDSEFHHHLTVNSDFILVFNENFGDTIDDLDSSGQSGSEDCVSPLRKSGDNDCEKVLELSLVDVVLVTAIESCMYVITSTRAEGIYNCHRFLFQSFSVVNVAVGVVHEVLRSRRDRKGQGALSRHISGLRRSINSHIGTVAGMFKRKSLRSSTPDSGMGTRSATPMWHRHLMPYGSSRGLNESVLCSEPSSSTKNSKKSRMFVRSRSMGDSLDDIDMGLFVVSHSPQHPTRSMPVCNNEQSPLSYIPKSKLYEQVENSASIFPSAVEDFGSHGNITFSQVEELLSTVQEPGTWLLRSTNDSSIPYVISLRGRQNRVKHANIILMNNEYKISGIADSFEEMDMLLAHVIGMEVPVQGQLLLQQILPSRPQSRIKASSDEQTLA
eukprot:gene6285-7456_t